MTTSVEELSQQVSINLELLADVDAPPLNVHTVGEYVYCKRAGTIAFESGVEAAGDVPLPPALGGLPWHDLDRLRARKSELLEYVKIPIACNVGVWVLLLLVRLTLGTIYAMGLAPALYYFGRWLVGTLRDLHRLTMRIRVAEQAAQQEPNWDERRIQKINYWGLVRAGFVVEEKDNLVDRQLGLSGCPWRVLHRENRVYPVLRVSTTQDSGELRRYGQLRDSQLAKMAAYSHLLHLCERAESSWAIVLLDASDEGFAIPVNDKAWSLFREGIALARREIRWLQQDPRRTPEPNENACRRCPLAEQTEYKTKPKSATALAEPRSFTTTTQLGKSFHCTCGDRFAWLPPHEKNFRLGL
ncbi:MAG: hypothetical protein R3C28_32460 [Pirellulaceae bacterium]